MFDELGFYDKPAAIKHHGNYSGGLFDHSFAVGMKLKELTDQLGLKWKSEGSPILVGLLHDICKCDNYILADGNWEWNKEQELPGHGEKSLIMVLERMQIHEDAGMCIRWHMGAFDDAKNWEYYSRAVRKDEKVLWTHTADMYVSNVLGI